MILTDEQVRSEIAMLIHEYAAQPYTGANKICALMTAQVEAARQAEREREEIKEILKELIHQVESETMELHHTGRVIPPEKTIDNYYIPQIRSIMAAKTLLEN